MLILIQASSNLVYSFGWNNWYKLLAEINISIYTEYVKIVATQSFDNEDIKGIDSLPQSGFCNINLTTSGIFYHTTIQI